jgi:superfamily II DNA or RNA helicase
VVESKRITTLAGLDLAALLRVMDANWHLLAERLEYVPEARHYLKEMRTLRDRWAHAAAAEFSPEDVYRDLDTLQRFLVVIGAGEELLGAVKLLKGTALPLGVAMNSTDAGVPDPTAFRIGHVVALRSNPALTGAVTGVHPGRPETRYSVFQNGAIVSYYESQLQAAEPAGALELITLAEFDAYLTARQIRHPSTSLVYSLNAARIECVPYQYRPVLKFLRAERPRLLIADGVGVGKTIEAGLILKELEARADIQRVLVICPKPLVAERKWESEMKRFDERFLPLDGDKLRYCINETDLDGVWPDQYAKAILPYSLLDEDLLFGATGNGKRRRKSLLDLDPPPRFDLVIVDEAQHVRNPETYAHKCVRFFCDNADAALFLTATPLEMSGTDLYVLLNLLRPDLVRDPQTFEIMTAPNPAINGAAALVRAGQADWQAEAQSLLRQAAETAWGALTLAHDPSYAAVMAALGTPHLSQADRVHCLQRIEQLHTLSGIINRTRRRDIGDFTIRRPDTVIVEFTPAQRKLHDDVLTTQALILTTLHPTTNVGFLMTMIRRQAASCLYGLVPLLRDILTRHLSDLNGIEGNAPDFDPGIPIETAIAAQIAEVLRQAEALDPTDPKLEAVQRVVREKVQLPNRRVMVFSTFRHTLTYLLDGLSRDTVRVGLIHGDISDEDRRETRRRFELAGDNPDALDVLLISEVGTEGLDYQCCDCIVNYDLPWNPMRIEQRIGRIDRRGQPSEKIRIVNIITPGTVDADIYNRCLLRIGIFERELGASDEILGGLTRELQSIAEDFRLTEKERAEKLQQLADNNVRLICEQQELEERQAEFFALRIPLRQAADDLRDASSRWLSAELLTNLVQRYLAAIGGGEQEWLLGEKPVKTLRLNQEMRNRLLQDYAKLPRSTALTYREWEAWLKGSLPHLRVTFGQQAAAEAPDAALLSPVHPVVRQAANHFAQTGRVVTGCQIRTDVVPAGDYAFAIYQWRSVGLQEDLILQPIALDARVRDRFADLMPSAERLALQPGEVPTQAALDDLEAAHYAMWAGARTRHREMTAKSAAFRLASLESSHKARLALLRDQLGKVTEERIRRMHHAQIERAEQEYERRIADTQRAIAGADLQAQVVAYGVFRATPESRGTHAE